MAARYRSVVPVAWGVAVARCASTAASRLPVSAVTGDTPPSAAARGRPRDADDVEPVPVVVGDLDERGCLVRPDEGARSSPRRRPVKAEKRIAAACQGTGHAAAMASTLSGSSTTMLREVLNVTRSASAAGLLAIQPQRRARSKSPNVTTIALATALEQTAAQAVDLLGRDLVQRQPATFLAERLDVLRGHRRLAPAAG